MGVTISGMTGAGSIRHNNRSFSAANVDRSRTEQNIVFCNEDLKQVYHMVFDEALAAYNAKKTKTRDKIPDYYEHIRQSKQEKLFHEAIFQIGNMSDCGCGTPDGERAAAALKDFAESFAERNPHLRVFNMVLHMDEATPHLHVDFIPVATEQSRGLATRVSMKQALKQQGFVGVGRKQTEWAAWMEREKEALTEIAQRHDFEIISLGTNRPHMDLPQFKEAAARLEAVQQQTAAVEQEVAELERQRDALKGTVRLLKEADRVKGAQTVHFMNLVDEADLLALMEEEAADAYTAEKEAAAQAELDRLKAEEEAKKAEEEAATAEPPKENKITKYAGAFLGIVALIALAAGGGFYFYRQQMQKKKAEKEALDPDVDYTEDKGDFEIPTDVPDEDEAPDEQDTEPI